MLCRTSYLIIFSNIRLNKVNTIVTVDFLTVYQMILKSLWNCSSKFWHYIITCRWHCIMLNYHIWASARENLTLLVANNKCADQPAQPCSWISAFVVLSMLSIIFKLTSCKSSVFYLVSEAEQTDLSPALRPHKGRFSRGEPHICLRGSSWGGGTGGQDPPPPEKSQKYRVS